MSASYWSDQSDHYQYQNSAVLKNLPDIRDAKVLEVFEQRATTMRLDEVLSASSDSEIGLSLWQTIHRILFQDIYAWAGEIRTVQLAKGNTTFAIPEYIATEAKRIFDQINNENLPSLERHIFIQRLAYYFGELNVLHPFREGNGRTQKLLFDEIARRSQYVINWAGIEADALLEAVIIAFHKQDYSLLAKLFDMIVIKHLKR
jgi:cell filamentation protein